MSDERSQVRDMLKKRLDSLQVPADIPSATIHRAKRRRIAASAATGAFAMVVLASAVYGATALTDGRRSDISPVDTTPMCSPEQVDELTTEVSDPIGTGAGHPGVYFEVRITDHDPDCEPTLYIELDDFPALPPDGEGPDADEFRHSSDYLDDENPCLSTTHAAGDFLYSGTHTIEVGVGCDPDEVWPHGTQRIIRFDGDSHQQIDDPEAAADVTVFLEGDVPRRDLRYFVNKFADIGGITNFEFVSKREAFKRFKTKYRDQPEYWENLPTDALPAYFLVRLSDPDDAARIAERLRGLVGVDEVLIPPLPEKDSTQPNNN